MVPRKWYPYRDSKGSKVYVEGKLQTSTGEDRQSGEKKYRTEIVARDLVRLGSREKGNGAHPPRSGPGREIEVSSCSQRWSH